MFKFKIFAVAIAISSILVVGNALADNLIVNGDFELGNNYFYSEYSYVSAVYHNSLGPPGVYAIGTNPNLYHSAWGSFADHTADPGDKMMIVNGDTVAGKVVWAPSTPVTVLPNTTYYFSVWLASSYATSPASLSFTIDGMSTAQFTISPIVGNWQQYYASWYSADNTSVSQLILNRNAAYSGNDFVIDDIVFSTERPGPDAHYVPEPATMLLLGFGLVGLAGARRFRN